MNKYEVALGVNLRTSSVRRFLVVSVTDRRAKVEASTNDDSAAQRLITKYRGEFGPGTRLMLIDQAGLGGQDA
jgi:hypothetical protein